MPRLYSLCILDVISEIYKWFNAILWPVMNNRMFVDVAGLAISIMITMKTLFSCLAYTIIIGDSFSSFLKAFGVPTWASDRDTVMWTLMSTIVFPLCLLKSLDALKYTVSLL